MAPMKFEDNLKEKLEARKLEVNQDSWDKLTKKLEVAQQNSNPRINRKLVFAAACVVGLLLVSALIFDQNKQTMITPTIVDTIVNDVIEEMENVSDVDTQKNEVLNEQITSKTTNNTKFDKVKETQDDSSPISTDRVVNNEEKKEVLNNEELIRPSLKAQGIKEVVTNMQSFQEKKTLVSDAEIDALLLAAQKDIASQDQSANSKTTIDANLLLQDIETELDNSLRDRVLNAIKSGYENVKTAVVERNN